MREISMGKIYIFSGLSSPYSVCKRWSCPKRNIDTHGRCEWGGGVGWTKKWTNIYCRVLSGWGFFAIFMRIYVMLPGLLCVCERAILCVHIYCERWGNVPSAFYRSAAAAIASRRSRRRRYIQFQKYPLPPSPTSDTIAHTHERCEKRGRVAKRAK